MTTAPSQAPRLLLTGGAGYIGSHTAVTLLNAGCDVVIIDNLSNSNAASVDAVQKITGRPVSFHPIDLRDQPSVETVLREERIDAVVLPEIDRPELPDPHPAPSAPPALSVRGLNFAYPDDPDHQVLHDICGNPV